MFLQNFGVNASFIDSTYRAVMKFIPITLDPTIQTSIWGVENASSLTTESIKSIKWIKPAKFCKPNQCVAHTVTAFLIHKDANKAIQKELSIKGRKVSTHKQLPESNRCYNCHSLDQNHFAKDCPKEVVCGSNHHPQDCEVVNPKEQFCVNCNTHGHPAWDPNCQAFIETHQKMWKLSKEAKYKYFPIPNNPTTWETVDGDIINPSTGQKSTFVLPTLPIPQP
jgi:hypothetical protein